MLPWILAGLIAFLLFCNLCMWVAVYNVLIRLEKSADHTEGLTFEIRAEQLRGDGIYSTKEGVN